MGLEQPCGAGGEQLTDPGRQASAVAYKGTHVGIINKLVDQIFDGTTQVDDRIDMIFEQLEQLQVVGRILPSSPTSPPGTTPSPSSLPPAKPPSKPKPARSPTQQAQALATAISTAAANPDKPAPPTPNYSAQVLFLVDLADNGFYGPPEPPPEFAIANLINAANNGSVLSASGSGCLSRVRRTRRASRGVEKDRGLSAIDRNDHRRDVRGGGSPGARVALIEAVRSTDQRCELTELGLHLFRSGFAVGINRAEGQGPPRCFGLVIRGGPKGEIQKLVERIVRAEVPGRAGVRDLQKPGGRTVHQLGASPDRATAWWTEGDDLVVSLVSPGGPDAIIDALDGRAPNAIDHPIRQALFCAARTPPDSSRSAWLILIWPHCPPCPRSPSVWAWERSSDSTFDGVFRASRS